MQISVLANFIFLAFSFIILNFSYIDQVYSQSDELEASPVIEWTFDLEGDFSYCVYEGKVTLDSENVPQPFCIVSDEEFSFENMHSTENDDIDTYKLASILLPEGLFGDDEDYSVCVAFTPSSTEEAGFNTAESCQTFTIEDDNREEEPFINLDDGVLFADNEDSIDEGELPEIPQEHKTDESQARDKELASGSQLQESTETAEIQKNLSSIPVNKSESDIKLQVTVPANTTIGESSITSIDNNTISLPTENTTKNTNNTSPSDTSGLGITDQF